MFRIVVAASMQGFVASALAQLHLHTGVAMLKTRMTCRGDHRSTILWVVLPTRCSRHMLKGTLMIFTITYKNVELREPVETEAARHTAKLGKLLKSYSPDLVKLHGVLAKLPRKEEYNFTLNLTLPTGIMHCSGTGQEIRDCLKVAFVELQTQLKKHKDHLRHDYDWKRRRPRTEALA